MAPLRKLGFNPRTRESATKEVVRPDAALDVSIHALVRVRHLTAPITGKWEPFQSTHS